MQLFFVCFCLCVRVCFFFYRFKTKSDPFIHPSSIPLIVDWLRTIDNQSHVLGLWDEATNSGRTCKLHTERFRTKNLPAARSSALTGLHIPSVLLVGRSHSVRNPPSVDGHVVYSHGRRAALLSLAVGHPTCWEGIKKRKYTQNHFHFHLVTWMESPLTLQWEPNTQLATSQILNMFKCKRPKRHVYYPPMKWMTKSKTYREM